MASLMRAVVLLVSLFGAAAMASERGRPDVRVWTSQDYAGAENRALLELPDGRVLVSNNGGLMAFDGERWRYWNHPRLLSTLSPLVPDGQGRFFAHWRGDLGWYSHNGRGAFEWHSLLEQIPVEDRLLDGNIRVQLDRGRNVVWYLFNARLFVYDLATEKLTTVRRGLSMIGGFLVDGEFWIHHDKDLLLTSSGPTLQFVPVPGREPFGRHGIVTAFSDANGTWVLNTHGELFRRPPGRSEFEPVVPQHWERWRTADARRLEPTPFGYALLSTHAALELLDADGNVIERYGPTDGVPDNRGNATLVDRDGGLWLAQSRTIARIDLGRAITRFDASLGLKGAALMTRWRGVLFVSDLMSVYRMRPGAGIEPARFERVLQDIEGPTCLAQVADRLLIGGVDTYEILGDPDGRLEVKHNADHPMRICNEFNRSRFRPDRIYAGHSAGVTVIEAIEGGWRFTPLPQITQAAHAVVEIDAGHVLVADRTGKVWRTTSSPSTEPPMAVTADAGLPVGPVKLYPGRGGPWLATVQGLRRWDDTSRRVVMPLGLPEDFTTNKAFAVLEDLTGRLWLRGDGQAVAVPHTSGYVLGDALAGVSTTRTTFQFLREDDVLWMARSDDLVRIDLARQQPLASVADPLLAKVIDMDTGEGLPLTNAGVQTARNLRFTFSTPSALATNRNLYRTRLSGIDDEFGEWSERTEREVTNLADGEHVFDVEAQDALGRIGRRPPFSFAIAPPWFRTPWAYSAYVATALLALWMAMRFGARRRQRQMMLRQQELEATVAARTAELSEKNAQLADQADRLLVVDRLKTRFFVNVGHEFRTPLTLVLGPIDDLLRDARERLSERVRGQLQLAQRNARRVLDLIVELLDVNRLEQGQLMLTLAADDLVPALERVAAENEPLVARFGQRFRVDLGGVQSAPCQFDPLQIERALSNLIGNAAKYSPRGTAIELTLAREAQAWAISVRDQGRGIAPEALPHVFDRFFQTDGSDRASGYGIGLSLVREIALAHGGEVSVQSTLGIGSTFVLRLPLGDSAAARPGATVFAVAGSATDGKQLDDHRHAPGRGPRSDTQSDSANEERGERSRERVLVVDDHDDLRLRVRDLLSDRFEVIEAAEGNAAWQLARDELPDLIVSDVMMPGCDGVELTRRLRSHADTNAIGILLLTAKVGSEHAVAGLNAGANDYLAKPFDSSELLARCEAIVAHTRRLQHRLAAAAAAVPVEPIETPDARWQQRLDQHIAANLHEAEFGIEALAKCMHADRTQLFRKCKELLGQSPSDYLRDARLAHAHRLLMEDAGNISEIAYASGFDSLSSFTRAFKTRYGEPPSQVRSRRSA